MPTDRRWSDADQELIREAIHSKFDNVDEQTDAVLDALTAAGWRQTAEPGCTCPTAGVMVQPGCTAHSYRGGTDAD